MPKVVTESDGSWGHGDKLHWPHFTLSNVRAAADGSGNFWQILWEDGKPVRAYCCFNRIRQNNGEMFSFDDDPDYLTEARYRAKFLLKMLEEEAALLMNEEAIEQVRALRANLGIGEDRVKISELG